MGFGILILEIVGSYRVNSSEFCSFRPHWSHQLWLLGYARISFKERREALTAKIEDEFLHEQLMSWSFILRQLQLELKQQLLEQQ